MTKRILTVALCLIMALSAVGCGQQQAAPSSSAAPTASTAPADTSAPDAAAPSADARVLKWSANSPEGYPDY